MLVEDFTIAFYLTKDIIASLPKTSPWRWHQRSKEKQAKTGMLSSPRFLFKAMVSLDVTPCKPPKWCFLSAWWTQLVGKARVVDGMHLPHPIRLWVEWKWLLGYGSVSKLKTPEIFFGGVWKTVHSSKQQMNFKSPKFWHNPSISAVVHPFTRTALLFCSFFKGVDEGRRAMRKTLRNPWKGTLCKTTSILCSSR